MNNMDKYHYRTAMEYAVSMLNYEWYKKEELQETLKRVLNGETLIEVVADMSRKNIESVKGKTCLNQA